jgi:hypothetical protein
MLSHEYQVLFIGDQSSHQRFVEMLRDAEDADFAVRKAGSWQSAEPQISAGGLDAIVWNPPAGEGHLAFLKEACKKKRRRRFPGFRARESEAPGKAGGSSRSR